MYSKSSKRGQWIGNFLAYNQHYWFSNHSISPIILHLFNISNPLFFWATLSTLAKPSSFILQAFQYFMPINFILSGSKTNDYKLFLYSFYRLDEYMVSTEDIGLIAVFIIDCVLFLFIVVLFAFALFRRKK